MNIKKLFALCFIFALSNMLVANNAKSFEISAANRFCGARGRSVTVSPTSFKQLVDKADSQIFFNKMNFSSKNLDKLEIEYRAKNLPKSTWGQLYYSIGEEGFSGKNNWKLPTLVSDGQWHTLSLTADNRNMNGANNWLNAANPITKIRLDLIDQAAPGGWVEVRRIRFFAELPQQLEPASKTQHYLEPGKPAKLSFSAKKGAKLPAVLAVEMLDFNGDCRATGKLTFDQKSKKYSGTFTFPAGFSELHIPQAFSRFGVTALPDNSDTTDTFFGINICYSRDDLYYRLLNRYGFKSIRKWHPADEEKSPGVFTTKNQQGYEYLTESGQRLLNYNNGSSELYPRTPSHMPVSYLTMDKSLSGLFKQRGKYMMGYQLFNELDMKKFPATEYIPFYSAASFLMAKHAPELDCVAFGLACGGGADMLDVKVANDYYRNGMMQYVDKVSFHTYNGCSTLWRQLRQIRNLLMKHDKGNIPVWITESGMPWRNGIKVVTKSHGAFDESKPRAPIDEDISTAWHIVSKACLAKAAGIEKYFVFIWNFFPENIYNFGLIDKHDTPHRTFSTYAFCANILSGLEYRGNLHGNYSGVYQTLVFSDGERHVAVILSDDTVKQKISLPPNVTAAYAMDGSRLKIFANRTDLKCATYLVLSKLPKLDTNTEGYKLAKIARSYQKRERTALPVVLNYQPDKDTVYASSNYITFPEKLSFKVTNLADYEVEIAPELTLPSGAAFKKEPPARILLAPNSEQEFTVELDLSSPDVSPEFEVSVRDTNGKANPLTLPFLALEKCRTSEVDFNVPERWTIYRGNKDTIRFSREDDGKVLKIAAAFSKKDNHTICPRYIFRNGEKSLEGSVGISFELKADFHGGSKFFEVVRILNGYRPRGSYQLLGLKKPTEEWVKATYLWPSSFNLKLKDLSFMFAPGADNIDLYFRNIKILYK